MVYFYAAYLLFMNLLAFFLMLADKRLAQKHRWRIRERTLLGVSLFGGGVGSFLGMYLFRHKTRHFRFVLFVPFSVVLWIFLSYFFFF